MVTAIKEIFPALVKNYTYQQPIVASDSAVEAINKYFRNMVTLQDETGLKGLRLLSARMHNAYLAYVNPIAFTEYAKNGFSTVPRQLSGYSVKKLPGNRYRVSVTNGNCGARVFTEKEYLDFVKNQDRTNFSQADAKLRMAA